MGVLVYAVFKMFLKHTLEIDRVKFKELIEIVEHQMYFGQIFVKNGWILVRFLSKMVGFWSDFQVELVR